MDPTNAPPSPGAPAAAPAPSGDEIARSYLEGKYPDATIRQAALAQRFARTAPHAGAIPQAIDEFMSSFGAGAASGNAGSRGHDGRFASAAPTQAAPAQVAASTNTGPAATNVTGPTMPANPALWPEDVVRKMPTADFMKALTQFEQHGRGGFNPYAGVVRAHERERGK